MPGLFIAWETYQRRAEVLAPMLGMELLIVPNRFRSRWLRPLDYVGKLFVTLRALRRSGAALAIAQAPPHLAALAPKLLGVPYVIDSHNGMYQAYWGRLPGASWLMRGAHSVIVHNSEIIKLAHSMHPGIDFRVLTDPIAEIGFEGLERRKDQILLICSFDGDEPLEAIVSVVEQVPDYAFVVTANPDKLPAPLATRLAKCENARLTGYLSAEEYQRTLCSSAAAIALTETEATQQSGACEALSSDTPLIASRTKLSEELFGDWAVLVENTPAAIVRGIRSLDGTQLDLSPQRDAWNARVQAQLGTVSAALTGAGTQAQ